MDEAIFTQMTQLIRNYAFPIVCCVALFWRANKDAELHREERAPNLPRQSTTTRSLCGELITEVRAGRREAK